MGISNFMTLDGIDKKLNEYYDVTLKTIMNYIRHQQTSVILQNWQIKQNKKSRCRNLRLN